MTPQDRARTGYAEAFGDEPEGLVFVPGHGAVMGEKSFRERDLANRRRYLAAIAGAKGRVSLKEATAGCEPPFLGEAWHEENYL